MHPFDLAAQCAKDGIDLTENFPAGSKIDAMEGPQILSQAAQILEDKTKSTEPFSFGTFFQGLRLLLLGPCPNCFEKEGGFTDQVLAGGMVGFLVVAKPGHQVP